MRIFTRSSPKYIPLGADEVENKAGNAQYNTHKPSKSIESWLIGGSVVLILTFAGFLLLGHGSRRAQPGLLDPRPSPCIEPALRREWRQLNHEEQTEYIKAVQCMHSLPSRLKPDGQRTDDFPMSHRLIEHYAHDAAPFLPWHRYFIHLYETVLKEECGYKGSLTYWDWTLDWQDPAKSPIWDSETGFGGDGNTASKETVGFGHCVENGPFASYTVRYENNTVNPHCLSRGFGCMEDKNSTDIGPHQFDGTFLSPRTTAWANAHSDFFNFTLALESGPHNALPNGVCGDFYSFDAPADPVFYLHHAQLDRLWWLWQQQDSGRIMEYNGPSRGHSEEEASLDDTLPLHGLAREPRVAEVMDTQGGLLCYRY